MTNDETGKNLLPLRGLVTDSIARSASSGSVIPNLSFVIRHWEFVIPYTASLSELNVNALSLSAGKRLVPGSLPTRSGTPIISTLPGASMAITL